MGTAHTAHATEIARLGKVLVEARQRYEMASMQFETAIVRYELLPDHSPWLTPVNQNTGIFAQHAELTKQQLIASLRKYQGNILRVATDLGVHRRQIYRWCKRYGLDLAHFRERTTNDNAE
jgi:transcriptional regulator of acetoin/glycerol metabolism